MSREEKIKAYFDAANSIVIQGMYLNSFSKDNISIEQLKKYNPGHLGSSLSINFILANLNYFFNHENLKSQLVVGTGHAGISLITNLWLSGILEKYYKNYSRSVEGLDNLIKDFGEKIRSEINPEYPTTIYDGGELGYSLGVAYGYALSSEADIVPCIIGDGEAETGTLTSSWYLSKILKTKSKVLPIINLNGLKMGSSSILSMMSKEELTNYFKSLGYAVFIVDATSNSEVEAIRIMQESLAKAREVEHPLIIFKSRKGYTLPVVNNHAYEGDLLVHKNPLSNVALQDKLEIIRCFLNTYSIDIFSQNGQIIPLFDEFKVNHPENKRKEIKPVELSSSVLPDEYLASILKSNQGTIFSPDELVSNKFGKCADYAIEMLNESVLQAVYQGFIHAGNIGYFISYEGFMPILSSMITQYYKYLYQKNNSGFGTPMHSLNYILTSTSLENTYSHQNPDFVNCLFEKKDNYYNVFYPKDRNSLLRCIEYSENNVGQMNVITFSKRHDKVYQELDSTNINIETIVDSPSPELILCATGDYMLDQALLAYEKLSEDSQNIKVVYVTKPQILSIDSKEALSDEEFNRYFDYGVPVVYLFTGYASTIKSLLYDREINCKVLGYNDAPSAFGNFYNNATSNGLGLCDIISLCKDRMSVKKLSLRRKTDEE